MADLPEYPSREQEQSEELTSTIPPTQVNVDDSDLLAIIDKKISESNSYAKNVLKLSSRAKTNEDFWVGKQYDENKLENWQIGYKDNLIWQDLETRISIAAGRMPDIVVVPVNHKDTKKRDAAKTLELGLTTRLKNDVSKRLIKNGLRDNHLQFLGTVKVRWNKDAQEGGDYEFVRVRQDRLIIDYTATIPEDGFTADNMDMIAEWVEEPLSVVVNKFPAKKDDIYAQAGIVRGNPRQLMRKIKYLEVWLTWWDEQGKPTEMVVWKYNNLILDKKKHPYWDWEGYEKSTDQISEMGENVIETLYHNHLDRPRKPYIFFSHINSGRSPYDDTTPVEQALPLQRTINKRGRQITEIADRAVPKLGFAGEYITKEEARRVTQDPDEHIWLKGAANINQALMYIPASPPPAILYTDQQSNRMQIDSKFATHGTTRGEVQTAESGISKQITREGDLTISDDIVNIVVERVVYEMANWSVQMMKLNYDKEHYVKDLGPDGEMLEAELSRDLIDDGILVKVQASTTDKVVKRSNALNLASAKQIDPYTLYEDMDLPNPKERTKRLLSFLSGNLAEYLGVIGVESMSGDETSGGQQALLDIQQIEAGESPSPPSKVNPEYVQTFSQYINSEQFTSQPPENQQKFQGFIGQLKQQLAQSGG